MNQRESYRGANFVYISSVDRRAFIFYIGDEAHSYFKVSYLVDPFETEVRNPVSQNSKKIPSNFTSISEIADLYGNSDNIKFFELTEDEFMNHVLLEVI